MKSKAPLVLLEQLIMLLVFALAATACLGILTAAHNIRLSAQRQDDAVFLAQNSAEIVKCHAGNLQKASDAMGGILKEDTLYIFGNDGLYLQIQKTESPVSGLGQAELRALHEDASSDVLFSLTVCWQEVSSHEP